MPEGSLALLGLVRRVLTSGLKLVGASPKLAKRPEIDTRQADTACKGTVPAMARAARSAETDPKLAIRMMADRILVIPSREAGERKSRSGILIPATANVDRRLVWGEVSQVGPTVRNVEESDSVLFAPDAGFEVEIRGDEYLILRERDVHAVASGREGGQTGLYL